MPGIENDKFYELEADLEKDAIAFAKRTGWLTRKFKHPGRRSAPDRWFAKSARLLFVEFKRRGNTPTVSQYLEIHAMLDAGLDVVWLDSIEDFRSVLR